MPSPKLTAAGCPRFTGTVFKDYLDNDFKMFLRREGIARDQSCALNKEQEKLYMEKVGTLNYLATQSKASI